jgi:hypothetical protein
VRWQRRPSSSAGQSIQRRNPDRTCRSASTMPQWMEYTPMGICCSVRRPDKPNGLSKGHHVQTDCTSDPQARFNRFGKLFRGQSRESRTT